MRRMINEYTRMEVRQDLYPSSETSECPLMFSFALHSFTYSVFNMF